MEKQILSGEEARRAVKVGIDKLADAVKSTLGPKGQNVILEKAAGRPLVTNDGVTIAKEIELADPFENAGAQLIKEAATQTNEAAGDGTTTATLLTQVMVTEGLRQLAVGASPVFLRQGMGAATQAALAELKLQAQEVSGQAEIAQVGTISSGLPEVGKLIAEAIEKVGPDGIIMVEESKSVDTYCQVVEGMEFDLGYISHYMVTDNQKMQALIDDAYILFTDQKLTRFDEVQPILEACAQAGKYLVMIAEDFAGEALNTLIYNRVQSNLAIMCIRAPGYGDGRVEMLKDMAALTGGAFFSDETGLGVKDAQPEMLGRARQVKVTRDTTTIVDGAGDPQTVEARISLIRNRLKHTDYDFDQERLKERLAKMVSGIAMIKVGAATETELQEKKLRIEDAIHATQAAVEEGIVPGGGTVFIDLIPVVEEQVAGMTGDERLGGEIVARALTAPLCQIAENAGLEGSVVLEKVRAAREKGYGFDAAQGEFCDMVTAGIIDPAKVSRSALETASSVAAMILTTEALTAEK